jgi:hypothetical protein
LYTAKGVVLDAGLKLANQRHARLLTTLDQAPLLVLTAPGQETTSLAKRLTDAGAAVAAGFRLAALISAPPGGRRA